MSLGNDRISRRNRRRKIAACYAIVCERKIVWPKNQDWTEWRKHGTDVQFRVNRRQGPRTFERGGGSLTQLVCRARQFHIREARSFRQRSFSMCGLDNFSFARFNPVCKTRQIFCDLFRRCRAQNGRGFNSGIQRIAAIRPNARWKFFRQFFAGRRIVRVKSSAGLGRAPFAGD